MRPSPRYMVDVTRTILATSGWLRADAQSGVPLECAPWWSVCDALGVRDEDIPCHLAESRQRASPNPV